MWVLFFLLPLSYSNIRVGWNSKLQVCSNQILVHWNFDKIKITAPLINYYLFHPILKWALSITNDQLLFFACWFQALGFLTVMKWSEHFGRSDGFRFIRSLLKKKVSKIYQQGSTEEFYHEWNLKVGITMNWSFFLSLIN